MLPTSGFRSRAEQAAKFADAVKKYGSESAARDWVAKPGGSEHETGRGVDLWLGEGTGEPSAAPALRRLAVWAWLRDHAGEFGFFPYTKEPWHWVYGAPHNSGNISAEIAAGQAAGWLPLA